MDSRDTRLDRLMHAAVYAVVVAMPFSVFYPLVGPLGPAAVELYAHGGLEPADLPAAILLALAACDRWLTRRGRSAPRRRGSMLSKIVLSIGVLALVGAAGAEEPRLALVTASRWLLAAGLLWAMVRASVPPNRLVYVLAASLCVHAVLALVQVWYVGPIGLPGELTLRPGEPSAPVVYVGAERWLRGYGMTFHPNVLGGYLAVGLTLLLPLLSQRAVRLTSYMLVIGLAATLSRSAGLGLLVAVPPLVWWLWRARPDTRAGLRRTGTMFACVVVVSLAVLWEPIVVRLSPMLVELGVGAGEPVISEQRSLDGRREMNELAVELLMEHPFLGVGAGNFPVVMDAGMKWLVPQYAHNVPLLLGAEIGVGGLLAWLALAVVPFYMLARRRVVDTWAMAGMAAWLVLLVVSLFDCYPWSLNAGRLLTVLVLSLVSSSPRR